jgi:cytochrome o ubiquinol oxidase operon protein cyoD
MSKATFNPKPYIVGFALSLIMTIIPYYLAVSGDFDRHIILVALAVFAILQVWVQLFFFLHLGSETKPRLKSWAFGFMSLVVVILVFGSIWIMNNLNYNMMPPGETIEYIQDEEVITPHHHDH